MLDRKRIGLILQDLGVLTPAETVEVVRAALGSCAHSLEVTNPSPRPRPLGGIR